MSERRWQLEEGGELVLAKHGAKHPWENRAFWRKKLRVFILQRDPICKQCGQCASEIVDHIKPYISATGHVSWILFSDVLNLRGLCWECHSKVTNMFDRGFGNKPKEGKSDYVAPTTVGNAANQFRSSSVSIHKLDAALPNADDIAALLAGIPD